MNAKPETTAADAAEPWCRGCGMPLLSWSEFHPRLACEFFKSLHDADKVRAALKGRLEAA